MLKQEWKNDARDRKKFPVHQQAEHGSCNSKPGGICLEPPFNVPFLVQLFDALR
jgi:hypothetical protein